MRLALIPVLCWLAACAGGHPPATGPIAAVPQLQLVVANQQSASASILGADGTMLHVSVGEGPHEAVVSPDGRLAVLSIYGARTPGHQLALIDLERDSVIRTIDLPAPYFRPHGMAFLPGAKELIATSEVAQRLVIVDLTTGELKADIPTNARGSHMVALTADGKHAFTANVADNSVSEIDVASTSFVRKFQVPLQPEGITVLPDGSEVWVGSNKTGVVSIISTASGTVTHTISGLTFPYRLGASPDGKLVAIVDGEGNKLQIANVAEHRLVGAVDLAKPRGVIITPDSKRAFVTQEDGMVAEVDLATLHITRTYAVQASPDGVGAGFSVRSPGR
jgi:DNA-binding beta-propeller fold protein YncE